MKVLIASILVTTGLVTATAARADAYHARDMIDAITTHDYASLTSSDQETKHVRADYVAAFTVYFDRSCNFLPLGTFESIADGLKTLIRSHRDIYSEAIQWGMDDAKEFLRQNGCATPTAKAVRSTLEAIWLDNSPSDDDSDKTGA